MSHEATFTLRLPDDLMGKLRRLAEDQRRSMNSALLTMIEQAPDPEGD